VVVILPFLLFRYPLCTDYLVHVAGTTVLLSSASSPLRYVFDVHWALIPNLGLPLFATALGKFLSPEQIVKSYNLLGIVGVSAGVIWLSRSINGRIQPTVLLALPMLHSEPVTDGLYNFNLGLALALFVLSAVHEATLARRTIILSVCAPIIFIVHLGALICLALIIFLLDCERERPIWRAFMTAPLGFLTVLPLYLLRTKPPLTHETVFTNLPEKLIAIASIFFSGNLVLSIGCALGFLAFAVFLYFRGAAFVTGWGLAVAGLWLAGYLSPAIQEVSAFVDNRIFWCAALISVAALELPAIESRRVGNAIVPLVTLILAVKLCAAINSFGAFDGEIAELKHGAATIPRGAPVMVAMSPKEQETGKKDWVINKFQDSRFYWHISSILPISGHGLDTLFFAYPGSAIIEPKPSFVLYIADLPAIPLAAPIAAYLFDHDGSAPLIKMFGQDNLLKYSINWGQRFPYLLFLNLGHADDPFAGKLQLVSRGSFFKIYRNPEVSTDLYHSSGN